VPQSLLQRPGTRQWVPPTPWTMFPGGQLVQGPLPPFVAQPGIPAPQGGGPSVDWAALARGLSQAGPIGFGSPGPQGGDEMRIAYGGRRVGNAIANTVGMTAPNLAPILVQGAKGAANEVVNAFNYLTATPNSDAARAFDAMLHIESRGNQNAVSPKGATGIAQIMPSTGPEAAKLAGLPWDPQRLKTDAEYNKALGFAYFQQKLKENNGDVFKAMAAYNAGQGRVQSAERRAAATGQPWTAFLPQETQNYIPQVMSRMGQLASSFGTPPPAFNAAPFQNAMQAQDQAAALLSQPFSAELKTTPLPERPAPVELQAPDFSAGDAAFNATAPKNPFDDPKEAVRVQRQQYWKGIGQAMASLSGGEGIGTMLMRMGAGALMGRARGQEMVDEREAEFEKEMMQFNRALANREDSKAVTSANILNQNIAQRNQHAEAIWGDAVKQIEKFQPQVVGDKLVSYVKDANDPSKYTMTVTPLGYGVQAEAILNKANIGIQMGQAATAAGQFAYQSQQVAARTALGIATSQALQQGNPQAAMEGVTTEAANRVRSTVRAGSWQQLLGRDTSGLGPQYDAEARKQAYAGLGVQLKEDGSPLIPLEGNALGRFQELYEESLTAMLYEDILSTGNLAKLFTNPTANAAYTTQRAANTKNRVTTNQRGQRSFSSSWDFEE
jgi:hypothetical protein